VHDIVLRYCRWLGEVSERVPRNLLPSVPL
jgi:hypothetical protein